MEDTILWIKGIFVTLTAFIANEYGILVPVMFLLLAVMIADFLTGMAASAQEGKDDPNKGLSSKVGRQGILKKVSYLAVIGVAMAVDWMLYEIGAELGLTIPELTGASTFFGLLVAIWFVINECISILENVARISGEKNLPGFLVKILAILKTNVEKTGDGVGDKKEEEK